MSDTHYNKIGKDYQSVWSTFGYIEWMEKKVVKYFKPGKCLVDIGGGNGHWSFLLYTKKIVSDVILVEPSSKMVPDVFKKNFSIINSGATDWILNNENCLCDRILIKESIHHFDYEDFITNLSKKVKPDFSGLIITRPKNTSLPFLGDIKEKYFELSTDIDLLENICKKNGFSVERHDETFGFSINFYIWEELVKSRYMSHLSHFSDEEIENYLLLLKRKNRNTMLNILDNITFLTIKKNI